MLDTKFIEAMQPILERFKKEIEKELIKEIQEYLLKEGHGGGNWRRLVNELNKKFK